MKPYRPETYVIINGMAYNVDKMPWYKRWVIKIKGKLGIRIDAI